ncbi:hypothetical protein ACUUL3_00480 [Thiovibrio sp. JS02]
MFQESELVNLILAVVALAILLPRMRRRELRDLTPVFAGFFPLFAALVFTVIEGVVLPDFFNTLEHACYAASGPVFAIALRGMSGRADDKDTAP